MSPGKKYFFIVLVRLLKYWKCSNTGPGALLSRANNPNCLSLSSEERRSSLQAIFMSVLWTHSHRSFLYWESQSSMQHSRWDFMRIELRGGTTSLNLLAMHLLLQSWLSSLQVLLAQIQVFTRSSAMLQ